MRGKVLEYEAKTILQRGIREGEEKEFQETQPILLTGNISVIK